MEYSKKAYYVMVFPRLSCMMSAASAAVCVMIRAFEALGFRITASSFTTSKSRGSDTRRPLTPYRPWWFQETSGNSEGVWLENTPANFPEGGDTGLRNEQIQYWSFTNRPSLLIKAGFNLQTVSKKHPSSPPAVVRAFNSLWTAKNSHDCSCSTG